MVILEGCEYHMSEVPLYNVSVSNDGHAHGRKFGPTLRVDMSKMDKGGPSP